MTDPIRLTWPPVPGAVTYRAVIRDETTGEYIKLLTDEPRVELDPQELDPTHSYEWRPQLRRRPDGEWEDTLPYLRVPLAVPPDAPTTTIRWFDDGSPAYRIVIRDETLDEIILKDGLMGTRYVVDWSRLDASHRYRYRLQVLRNGEWHSPAGYIPLNPPLALVGPGGAQAPASEEVSTGRELLFLFTVDTEIAMPQMRHPDPVRGVEHQIFAIHQGREVGIRYLMDLLDRYGFKATFFIDILLEFQYGEGSWEPVIEAIQERGHDIQLHLHPSPHVRFAREESIRKLWPAMATDDTDLFRRALDVAFTLFEKRVGSTPIAYRSGAYHLCDGFFPVLKEFGLRIDTSLYPFKNCRVSPWMWSRTQPFWVDDVLEVPVSWLVYTRNGTRRAQQLAPVTSGTAQHPALAGISAPAGAPPPTLVYLAHSNSLLRRERSNDPALRDEWNREALALWGTEEFELAQLDPEKEVVFLEEPDEARIQVLIEGLDRLVQRGDVRGLTFQELHDDGLHRWDRPALPVDPLPVWHTDTHQLQMTGTRRYSRAFLEHLDAEAREAR